MEKTPHHIQAIITKFLQKETSEQEFDVLKEWLLESEENRAEFARINDTFQSLVTVTKFNADKSDQAWKTLSDKMQGEKTTELSPIRLHYNTMLKIAASLTLIAASYYIFYYQNNQPAENIRYTQTLVQNSKGNKTSLLLPDSSVVLLNANSTLEYSADFGKNSREVTLVGEAFFDVRKGKHDFIVTTRNLSIQVKGTRFNVNSLDHDGLEKTTLEEGHVILQVKGKRKMYSMKPGDQVLFNSHSNKVLLKKVDPAIYSAWKEDYLHFENTRLSDIVRKLENRYKVTIAIDAALAQKEWITMTIENESIEDILELIKLSSSLQYKIEDKQITIFE